MQQELILPLPSDPSQVTMASALASASMKLEETNPSPGRGWRSFWLRPLVPEPPSPPWSQARGMKQAAKSPHAIPQGENPGTVFTEVGEGGRGAPPSPRGQPRASIAQEPLGQQRDIPQGSASWGNPTAVTSRNCMWFKQQQGHFSSQGKGSWGGNCSRTRTGNGNSGYR